MSSFPSPQQMHHQHLLQLLESYSTTTSSK